MKKKLQLNQAATLVAGALFVLATFNVNAQTDGANDIATSGDTTAGQEIVLKGVDGGQACSTCHGADGAGEAESGYPRLAGQPVGYLIKELADYADGTRMDSVMGPIAKALSEADMRNVAMYFSQAEAKWPTAPDISEQQMQLGRELATVGSAESRVQSCENCHGVGGQGLSPNIPYLRGQFDGYLKEQLTKWRSGERANDPSGEMSALSEGLTDAEIDAVAQWYASRQ